MAAQALSDRTQEVDGGVVWNFEPSLKSHTGAQPADHAIIIRHRATSKQRICRYFADQSALARVPENRGVPGSSPGLAIPRSACKRRASWSPVGTGLDASDSPNVASWPQWPGSWPKFGSDAASGSPLVVP
jgi:hypothetical protein